jgi:hypothetical protein
LFEFRCSFARRESGIIVVGVFILLLSFVGYLSAWKEFRIGLGLVCTEEERSRTATNAGGTQWLIHACFALSGQYFFFIAIITVILFAVGVAVYVKRNQASVYISQAWISGSLDTRAALQIAFYCCGLVNFNDSLTMDNNPPVYRSPCDQPGPTQPCQDLMVASFQNNFQTAGACGIAFSIIMLVSLAITAYLMVGIRESAVNKAIEKNRERNDRDIAKARKKGKGLKIPSMGADVL